MKPGMAERTACKPEASAEDNRPRESACIHGRRLHFEQRADSIWLFLREGNKRLAFGCIYRGTRPGERCGGFCCCCCCGFCGSGGSFLIVKTLLFFPSTTREPSLMTSLSPSMSTAFPIWIRLSLMLSPPTLTFLPSISIPGRCSEPLFFWSLLFDNVFASLIIIASIYIIIISSVFSSFLFRVAPY